MSDLFKLPINLVPPVDDGAADHLSGATLPPLILLSTSGERIKLGTAAGRFLVLYCYPMTGLPGIDLPNGWNEIPGARGCTPQACAFRDIYPEFRSLEADLYGLSTQSTAYQREVRDRLHLPFDLLSDEKLHFSAALDLPVFMVEGNLLMKRITVIFYDNKLVKHFYPVFPPDQHAEQVLEWLKNAKRLT